MTQIQSLLRENVIFIELLCAITAIIHYKKFKNSPWKYFIYYLIAIFILETISHYFLTPKSILKNFYFTYLVIPLQFVFLFWLYTINSLKKKKLFWIVLSIYITTFLLVRMFGYENIKIIDHVSYSIGCLLLIILVLLEFMNQIQSDDIVGFSLNTMFYINLGVSLFYLGTLPLFAFNGYLKENMESVWSNYWTIQLILVYVLNLFYMIALIWTKPNS